MDEIILQDFKCPHCLDEIELEFAKYDGIETDCPKCGLPIRVYYDEGYDEETCEEVCYHSIEKN